MPAVSVTGATFTVQVGAVPYTSQITSGTITTTPTIVRTKTLDSVAFDQTDLNSTLSIEFLFDGSSGLYEALQVATAAGSSVAVSIASTFTTWEGAAMYVESVDLTYPADGVATVSCSLTGTVVAAFD